MPAGETLAISPFAQFQTWMAEAEKSEPERSERDDRRDDDAGRAARRRGPFC